MIQKNYSNLILFIEEIQRKNTYTLNLEIKLSFTGQEDNEVREEE